MPRPRLPWFKVWAGATRDKKIAGLSDHTFRVWIELLDAASEQRVRGRFVSYESAAAIIRRKAAEVRLVAAAGLMDEVDGLVVMHDWDDWQRWRPDDAATDEAGTPPESHTNGSGITHESLRNGTSKTPDKGTKARPLYARAREDVDVEGDVEGERDEDESPQAPSGLPPAGNGRIHVLHKRGNPRVAAVIDAFKALKIDVTLGARDHAAIKHSNADPSKIAEVYDAVARCEYGDDFMRRRLTVHDAIEWINGYVEWKAENAWRQKGAVVGYSDLDV